MRSRIMPKQLRVLRKLDAVDVQVVPVSGLVPALAHSATGGSTISSGHAYKTGLNSLCSEFLSGACSSVTDVLVGAKSGRDVVLACETEKVGDGGAIFHCLRGAYRRGKM